MFALLLVFISALFALPHPTYAADARDPQVDEQLRVVATTLPNFHFVSAGAERFTETPDPLRYGVYRGAVPIAGTLSEGFKTLYDMLGVKTAIALDEPGEPNASTESETAVKAAKKAGVVLVELKLGAGIFRPTQSRMREIMTLLDDPENYPVFIYCADGRHKTGLVVAMYRYFVEGVPAQAAFDEMKDLGFTSASDTWWNAGLPCFFRLATGMETSTLCRWLPVVSGD